MQKIDLLYLSETIKASDALQNGLVTKIFNSEIFETEIVHQTEQIALQSSQVIIETMYNGTDKRCHCKITHAIFRSVYALNFLSHNYNPLGMYIFDKRIQRHFLHSHKIGLVRMLT